MSLQARIESLKVRHAGLEARISEEDSRPRPDDDELARLKLEKLHLKEELERLKMTA
ncbi:MAG TPA: YdcH family protein [Acidiphilium sp.]